MPFTFIETPIPGLLLVETRCFPDERGYFYEAHADESFVQAGIDVRFAQDNVSASRKGTVRGMHCQIGEHSQGKLVRVLNGSAFDAAVDLRRGSPTFGRWHGVILDARAHLALWAPVGLAHGFQALEDNTIIYYKCTRPYCPGAERSLHYADPSVAIAWPEPPAHVSSKDLQAPHLDEIDFGFKFDH